MEKNYPIFSASHLPALKRQLGSQNPGESFSVLERTFITPIDFRQRVSSLGHLTRLNFIRCIFNEDVLLGKYFHSNFVTFSECTFNKSISCSFPNVLFEHCSFNMNLTIDIDDSKNCDIRDLNIKGILSLNGKCQTLGITNINNDIPISNSIVRINVKTAELFINSLNAFRTEILNDTHAGVIQFLKGSTDYLLIGNIQIDQYIKLFNISIKKLSVGRIYGEGKNLVIQSLDVEEIQLDVSNIQFASFEGGNIVTLILTGINSPNNIINIGDVNITSLLFEQLYNRGLIVLRNLEKGQVDSLFMRSTDLGKSDFIYCNFSNTKLTFANSKMSEIFTSESEFPKKVYDSEGFVDHSQAQLAFGQLATAYQKQGDTIRSLEYSSREVESHYRELKWWSSSFFIKLNLWLNNISNHFGRNWVRGIIFTFTAGLLFFSFLLLSTNQFTIGLPIPDSSLFPSYLKFMNPLRFFDAEALFDKTKYDGNIVLNHWSHLWDFLGRVFVAYGYYQTIQAFRRYGRK